MNRPSNMMKRLVNYVWSHRLGSSLNGRSQSIAVKCALVITADPNVCTSIRLILMKDWEILTTDNLAEAVRLIQKQEIGVVFLDQDTPQVDWRNIVSSLSNSPYHACLIVLSQNANRQRWEEVARLGGYEVVEKPLESDVLLRMANAGWLYWRSQMVLFKSTQVYEHSTG